MAQKTIADLTAAGSIGAADLFEMALEAGGSRKTTAAQLADYVGAALTLMTDYTPTVAPASGTFTTAATVVSAKYTKIGKLVIYSVQFVLGTVGTGAGALEVGMPSEAAFPSTQLVEEYATVGRVDRGNASPGSAVLSIRQLSGATVIADGAGFRFTGYYLEA